MPFEIERKTRRGLLLLLGERRRRKKACEDAFLTRLSIEIGWRSWRSVDKDDWENVCRILLCGGMEEKKVGRFAQGWLIKAGGLLTGLFTSTSVSNLMWPVRSSQARRGRDLAIYLICGRLFQRSLDASA